MNHQDDEALHPPIPYAEPNGALRPLYLFADSQPLFWKRDEEPFLRSLLPLLDSPSPRAAYIGASNGDHPEFYAIFESAMDDAGIGERRMIPGQLEADDLDFLDRAHLILLAGGDVERGWKTFKQNGLSRILVRRHGEGALLIGISAGAVQLGLGGWSQGQADGKMVDTLRIIPHAIGAHEEDVSWAPLQAAVRHFGAHTRGYGIPFGAGLVYHPDHSLEPLGKPVFELSARGQEIAQHLLFPSDESARPKARA